MLYPRSLFGDSHHSSSNFTCVHPKPNEHGKPLSIGISFKTLMTYITAVCLGLTALSAVFLIWKHLHRYTRPKEQRQIVRIVYMPVVFCITSMLSILFYEASIYLVPITEAYEAFCITALFYLYIEYVCPDEGARAQYFASKPTGNKKQKDAPGAGLKMFNVRDNSSQEPLSTEN